MGGISKMVILFNPSGTGTGRQREERSEQAVGFHE